MAGVLWEYRNGLRNLGVDASVIVYRPHDFSYPYDEAFARGGIIQRRIGELTHIIPFIRRFDIFHLVYGRSVLPFHLDIPIIKLFNKKIVMTFLGCDIRPRIFKDGINEVNNCKYCMNKCRLEEKINIVKYWSNNADLILSGVDNSQLLDYYSIPYKPFVVPIDIEHWKPFKSPANINNKKEILIVHAPSNPLMKGTPIILKVIEKLKNKYPIKLELLKGVPNAIVRERLNAADIVIDQLGCGWHGKLSVESMAMGKPTLCYINDKYKIKYPQFKEIPLININSENLIDRLEFIITDDEERTKIGNKSRIYVEKIHDNQKVCKDLLYSYKSLFAENVY